MQRHFQQELESLKTTLIKMGSLAESSIAQAVQAITERNPELARTIIEGDKRINALEIEIDNAIIDLLALQQPVASDLRLILSAQKINNDLERIGDHAVNLAEAALVLAECPPTPPLPKITEMVEKATIMLREALDAFIHRDPDLGRKVLLQDDTIDQLNRDMVQYGITLIRTNQQAPEVTIEMIRISRNLERVADLATNIAEEVIFLTNARVVKHHAEELNP